MGDAPAPKPIDRDAPALKAMREHLAEVYNAEPAGRARARAITLRLIGADRDKRAGVVRYHFNATDTVRKAARCVLAPVKMGLDPRDGVAQPLMDAINELAALPIGMTLQLGGSPALYNRVVSAQMSVREATGRAGRCVMVLSERDFADLQRDASDLPAIAPTGLVRQCPPDLDAYHRAAAGWGTPGFMFGGDFITSSPTVKRGTAVACGGTIPNDL